MATRKLRTLKSKRLSNTKNLELEYFRKIQLQLKEIRDELKLSLIPALPEIIDEWERESKVEVRKTDSAADKVFRIIAATRLFLERRGRSQSVNDLGKEWAEGVEGFNKRQFIAIFRDRVALNLFRDEPWLGPVMDRAIQNNVSLIKNVKSSFLDDVEQTVFDGMRQGLRHESIAKRILSRVKDKDGFRGRFGKAETRAKLIARDQTNKFNGELTKARQTQLGIEKYVWRTNLDGRERPAHRARDGEVFLWTDPPSDGHPGQPIQCRCWAEPVLDDLFQ